MEEKDLDNQIREAFRERLQQLIVAKGTSLKQLMEDCGINYQLGWKYVNCNRLPSIENLYAICKRTHTSADWLLGLSNRQAIRKERKQNVVFELDFCARFNIICVDYEKEIEQIKKKITQGPDALYSRSNLTSTIKNAKLGKHQPKIKFVVVLSKELGLSVDYILALSDKE